MSDRTEEQGPALAKLSVTPLHKMLLGLYLFEKMLLLSGAAGGVAAAVHVQFGITSEIFELTLFGRSHELPLPEWKDKENGLDSLRAITEEEEEEEVPEKEQVGPLIESSQKLHAILQQLDVSSAQAAESGTGGVYFLPDENGKSKVVFKPAEEENESTEGDGYLREVAAYVLDAGLAGVPETGVSIVSLPGKGPQIGSIQMFVDDSEDAEDYGPGVFSLDDVHRIGVLDIRIVNRDRHSQNLMRNKTTGKLVPIDHGASFPSAFDGGLSEASFEWLMYPQAKLPFTADMLKTIEEIDAEKDVINLQKIGLKEGAQLSTWMATTLLKEGAKSGLTLFDIGSMIQRQGDRSEPSVLEKLFAESILECSAAGNEFFEVFTAKAHDTCTY
mmetsp:Transcript_16819/g.37214  ORF Transcript_16819/g.37214 Transcript_16819/m.37214 type:complete len:387 (+) Transcript_16819:122-1282(+)